MLKALHWLKPEEEKALLGRVPSNPLPTRLG